MFTTLKQDYFGWNEVRVSTIRELTDALKPLVNPAESAARLKQTLHSVFESVYEFDIETLKKQNIGQAAKHAAEVQRHDAVRRRLRDAARAGRALDSAQPRRADHAAHRRRDLRRRVRQGHRARAWSGPCRKNKGAEIGSLLHQLGVEVGRNPYGPGRPQADAGNRSQLQGSSAEARTKRPKPPSRRNPPPPEPAKAAAAAQAAAAKEKPHAKDRLRQKPPEKQEKPKKAAGEAAAAAEETRASRPRKPTKKGTKKPTTRKLAKTKTTVEGCRVQESGVRE